jgi:hypothetical protein
MPFETRIARQNAACIILRLNKYPLIKSWYLWNILRTFDAQKLYASTPWTEKIIEAIQINYHGQPCEGRAWTYLHNNQFLNFALRKCQRFYTRFDEDYERYQYTRVPTSLWVGLRITFYQISPQILAKTSTLKTMLAFLLFEITTRAANVFDELSALIQSRSNDL